ncbi:putative hydrolase of the HAD superfamily [Chitinophaga sp. CF118]|uniref:HAD family hydrolase n=1 Tax=Chitinophaga sp. CF118 TaxID=1884367 RepID=UPI0008E64410|nr:HAD family hydrolase [Chitinophaga sp. CF118]SFE27511.1 putative hydrolase of the HAD superfamily [Chitinophaga sp. CF118]
MNSYKHFSFDLWLTLIKSHPSFKQERNRFFYDNFNQKNKSLEEVTRIFRQVDLMCNAINEKTGNNLEAEEMYLMVISEMNDHEKSFHDIDLSALYDEMEQLVFKYLPVIYCDNTSSALSRLKQSGNNTLSLLSNTAFIKGRTLREVLKRLEIHHLFDFQLYSDEVGMSKPNQELFQLMIRTVTSHRNEESIQLNEIIHIGDNIKADIEGGSIAGISTLLINSNNKSILSLFN